jgi:hypothetical protein
VPAIKRTSSEAPFQPRHGVERGACGLRRRGRVRCKKRVVRRRRREQPLLLLLLRARGRRHQAAQQRQQLPFDARH